MSMTEEWRVPSNQGKVMNLGRVVISEEEIQKRVSELADEISRDYTGRNPLLISLLKGAFIFLADLVRHLSIAHEVEFITLSSYTSGTKRNRDVKVINGLKGNVKDRDIIIVEGIVDTGHTLKHLIDILAERSARSIRVCTLLDKPFSREVDVPVNYIGFNIPDVFVVGYGLDFREKYRNLKYIAELVDGEGRNDEFRDSSDNNAHSLSGKGTSSRIKGT